MVHPVGQARSRLTRCGPRAVRGVAHRNVRRNATGVGRTRAGTDRLLGPRSHPDTFEIHAGAHYRSFGLVSGLSARRTKSRSSRSTLDRVSSSPSTVGRHRGKPSRYRPASSRGRTVREAVPTTRWPNTSSVCPAPTVTLTLTDLERLLDRNLPASAHAPRAWWSNERSGTHTHARAWMGVGWMVDQSTSETPRLRFAGTRHDLGSRDHRDPVEGRERSASDALPHRLALRSPRRNVCLVGRRHRP